MRDTVLQTFLEAKAWHRSGTSQSARTFAARFLAGLRVRRACRGGRDAVCWGAMVLAFHKPYGVLCQFTADQPGQRTLAEFAFPSRVYPVGRLDLDSEGLLLLSDEAGFNHRLLDPLAAHPRKYWSQVEGIPAGEALLRLRRGGLGIQGYQTRPCQVRWLEQAPPVPPRQPPVRFRKSIPTSWLELTLIEGKNRQVRRMTAAVGLPTLRLMRVSIGGFAMGDLAPGQWCAMDEREVQALWRK